MSKSKFKIPSKKPKINFGQNNGYNQLYPKFSFVRYIENNEYFSEEHANEERHSLYNFFKCIREFSKLTWGEIKQNPKIFHCHAVTKNISILAEYDPVDLTQFKIPGLKEGRFVGFFDEENVFNILLYDSQHNIYERT